MITTDEISVAGGVDGRINTSYYLYKTGSYYLWALTPYYYNDNSPYMFAINSNGLFFNYIAIYTNGAASPVINIAPKYAEKMQGNGTIESPYTINT